MENNKGLFNFDIKLSCNVLKFLACTFMFIDHIGYGLLHNYMKVHAMDILPDQYTTLNKLYEVCRGIGRLAFPIFCFLLVEGFFYTRSIVKYIIRLAILAVISEIPFDLGLYGKTFYNEHQNIILTFIIALLMMLLLRYIENNSFGLSRPVVMLSCICAVIAFSDAAFLLHTDYSWKCMLLCAVLYFAREHRAFRLVAGAASTCWEKYAPLSFVLLYFYDPSVKPRFKYAFYLFYPLNFLVVYLLARLLI